MSDPFAGVGTSRAAAPQAPNAPFWKPSALERLAGKLVEVVAAGPRDFSDRAIFKGVLYRMSDHKPYASGNFSVGISSDLKGRISAADKGRLFIITFLGLGDIPGQGLSAPRLYDVRMVELADELAVRERLIEDAQSLSSEAESDDLPF
jgi:hypothetical protein